MKCLSMNCCSTEGKYVVFIIIQLCRKPYKLQANLSKGKYGG